MTKNGGNNGESRFVGRISVRIHLLPGVLNGRHSLLHVAVVEDTNISKQTATI